MLNIIIIIICFIFALLASLFLTKKWIGAANAIGFIGKDMNKYDKRKVADFGGMMPICAIVLTLFLYVFFKTFLLHSSTHFIEILVICMTLLIAGLIRFLNDVLSFKMTKDKEMLARKIFGNISRGLGGWERVLLTIPAAIPLIVINAGYQTITLPF
jgi:UDP-N-acetylmuramyl pentapeptide phosphotransferase/UDP-N-acetylglucosamine-1-phosphate transferase